MTDDARPRGRGRPPSVERWQAGHGRPLDRRAAEAPRTSLSILEASRDILVAEGMRAMTMAAVARRAHVDIKTIVYHFGNRRGLLEALIDFLYHDDYAEFAEAAPRLERDEDRWDQQLQAFKRISDNISAFRAYISIYAEAFYDPELRQRIGRYFLWGMNESAQYVYGDEARSLRSSGERRALDFLLVAALDGIQLHRTLAPSSYPFEEVFALLARLVTNEHRRQMGDGASSGGEGT